jgi:hypothetical protein
MLHETLIAGWGCPIGKLNFDQRAMSRPLTVDILSLSRRNLRLGETDSSVPRARPVDLFRLGLAPECCGRDR